MTLFSPAMMSNGSEDAEIWANLRDAIASSSGFQGWKQQQDERSLDTQPLDQLVRCYLRETLETLAY
ncbi:MAG: hypothetical protein ACFBSF_03175 [Leptolyngbyaceae cyanobacterium]